jgi:hypothetical protein
MHGKKNKQTNKDIYLNKKLIYTPKINQTLF